MAPGGRHAGGGKPGDDPPLSNPTAEAPDGNSRATPSSLPLRVPRSNSVQQLVQQWEVTASPVKVKPSGSRSVSASTVKPPASRAAAPNELRQSLEGWSFPAASSAKQGETSRSSAAHGRKQGPSPPRSTVAGPSLPAQTAVVGPTRSARADGLEDSFRSQPTHAVVHGTVGKMDWTPKYGLGKHMEGFGSPRVRAEPRPGNRAAVEQQIGQAQGGGAKVAERQASSSTKATVAAAAKDSDIGYVRPNGGRMLPPLMSLKSVQPETSLPSPASPIAPFAQSSTRSERISPSTTSRALPVPRPRPSEGQAADPPLLAPSAGGSSTMTQPSPPQSARESSMALDGARSPRLGSTMSKPSPQSSASTTRASRLSDVKLSVNTEPRSSLSSRTAVQDEAAIKPHPDPRRPSDATLAVAGHHVRDGLARTSDGVDIFDLEGKSPKRKTSWLPSAFLPEHSAASGLALVADEQDKPQRSPIDSYDTLKNSPTLISDGATSPTLDDASRLSYHCPANNVDGQLPVPADRVFATAAPPLHLPALDEYLSNGVLFRQPVFSDAAAVCTHEERELFGLRDGRETFCAADNEGGLGSRLGMGAQSGSNWAKRRTPVLEVAGGQLNLPQAAYSSAMEASSETVRQRPGGLRQRLSNKYAKLDADDGEELVPVLGANSAADKMKAISEESDGDDTDDGKTVYSPDDTVAFDALRKQISNQAPANDFPKRPRMPPPADSDPSLPVPSGVPSQMSTASHPVTRLEMFPPLMLLKENSLDELKSNAIGPRKPPGGLADIQLLGTIFDFIIGAEGSNFAAGLFRLEILRDFIQLMSSYLHFETYTEPLTAVQQAQRFLFQTMPSFLGLDFVSVFGYAVVFFVTWICITALALFKFWRMTKTYDPNRNVEGFESQGYIYKPSSRGDKLINTTIVFLLSTLYLPLSKLAVNALVWSSDFWPVDNPYKGGIDNPALVPLGDEDIWRQPGDFCYTTTMRKDGFNWAYIILPLAALTFVLYTLWYPWKMMMTIRSMLPNVSQYNELGKKRTDEEMEIEYARLLNRDKSPLNFLYNCYRRKWGFYKPMYILLFKFSNLIIIGVLAKDNCLFRSVPTKTMLSIQQITLIVTMSFLLGLHVYIKPFVDQISNRSEMVSRIGYVLTAVIGLLVALNVQGSTVYNTAILYLIQGLSYTGNIYFSVIGMSFVAHRVKRWQKRVDFSIDIFSPLLDLQKHIKRRVWQETLSMILLSGRGLHMPLEQVIAFSMSETDSWPPYLLDFRGSAAERHIENLKIVKQIGIEEYQKQVDYSRTRQGARMRKLVKTIQRCYAGPDAYFRPVHPPFPSGVSSFFGKAFVVPFPPTIVMRYDQGGEHTLQITTLEDFEAFVEQNESEVVRSKRLVRQALRALEGQRVLCPYVDNVPFGRGHHGPQWAHSLIESLGLRQGNRYRRTPAHVNELTMVTPVSYVEGTLMIERRHEHEWNGYNFASGFYAKVVFDRGGRRQESNGALTTVRATHEVSASRAFGLTDDFEMTPPLARFLKDNEHTVRERVPYVEALLQRYRTDFEHEARWKEREMPYSFETDVFDNHLLSKDELRSTLRRTVRSKALATMPLRYQGCITMLYERMAAINRSPVHRYWWLLFDDLWRMNSGDYALLRTHRRSFSPQFATSIAYTPMPRAELERYLRKRGLWKKDGTKGGPFNRGLLNRLYFYLNEVVFAGHHSGHSTLTPHHSKVHGENAAKGRPGAGGGRGLIPIGFGTTPQNATRRDCPSFEDLKNPNPRREMGSPAQDGEGPSHVYSHSDSRMTGGGTVYSVASIQDRSAYAWEQKMDGRPLSTRWQRLRIKTLQWLHLSPFVLDFDRERLFLYVQLVDQGEGAPRGAKQGKRYELLPERRGGPR